MSALLRFDVGRFLASSDFWAAVDFDAVPTRYRQAARDYLRHGVVPAGPLRLLLEGDLSCVLGFRDDLPGLLALCDWLHELPASCWGNPDQVQCWAAHVSTRKTTLALLAEMDASAEAREKAEGAEQPKNQRNDNDDARDGLEGRINPRDLVDHPDN